VLIFIRRWRRATTKTEPGTAAHQIDATEHGQRDTAIAPHPPANIAETSLIEIAQRYTTRAADPDKIGFKYDGRVSGVHEPPVTR
jgi:hypothetical protein